MVKVEPTAPRAAPEAPGFRTWNRSKRSVALDIDDASGRDQLEGLLGAADVVVHELAPAAAAALGLDDASLAARHPHVVVCSVLAWPANHRDAALPVDELLAMARLGICDEQFAMDRDGPVYVRFPLGSWGAAYLAAIGILVRLRVRDQTGRGGPAHTSLVQGAMVPMGMHWSRAERPSPMLAMGMTKASGGSQNTLFECSDGEWFHLMGNPALSPRFADAAAAGQPPSDIFRSAPRADWLDELWAHDVPAQPALPFGAVLDDEQARTNGYVVELDDPAHGRITVAGNPITITPPCSIIGPAPEHGAHTDAVLAEWAARSDGAPPAGAPPRHPLEGLRVLDLGSYLAGPYGPMLLADLGADVIKVEPVTGDGMRMVDWAFAGCQRGKRTVALDLKSPACRPALEALVRWADVVHHNLRMPAARRLGLDADAILAIKPDVVFCHTSSYGPIGPRADWPGYDQLFQALCGWEVLGAGEGNPPMWHRFGFMDHQCAMASVVATLAALRERDRTGQGQVVAASLLGAGVLTTSETFRHPDGALAGLPTLDHEQTGVAPDRCIVPDVDGDSWTAIAGDHTERVRVDQRDPFLDDAANRAAGLVAELTHGEWGRLEQPGALWWFGDLPLRIAAGPPLLGQHSVEILTEVGFSGPDIDALVAQGAAFAATTSAES
ncbi:MAG: hypothetical protein QOE63_1355 [Acidimicrobiaceae bacterium]